MTAEQVILAFLLGTAVGGFFGWLGAAWRYAEKSARAISEADESERITRIRAEAQRKATVDTVNRAIDMLNEIL